MLFDAKRTILIISPQEWEFMEISKHHYARELAALGHRVIFVDPPDRTRRGWRIDLKPTGVDRIEKLRFWVPVPYDLKFQARPVFDAAMTWTAKSIRRAIGGSPDIVWDFDNEYAFTDLRAFKAKVRVFHPVDEISSRPFADKHANIVFAVAQRFLDKIEPKRVPMHVIPHGLARSYEALARKIESDPAPVPRGERPLCVGFIGNLDRPDIDWTTIRRMVEANPAVTFRFIGPLTTEADSGPNAASLVTLRNATNVTFEGRKPPADIISRAHEVDAWLLPYDPAANVNAATNSHKLLEYLATGAPVITNRVEAYVGNDLVAMPPTNSNAELPALLGEVLANIDALNSPSLRVRRAAFALEHTYRAQLKQISAHLDAANIAKR